MSIYVDPILVGAQPAPWGYFSALTGPTGAQGIPGEAAFRGATGETGATGPPSSVTGYTGWTGPRGFDSTVPGPRGERGDTGPRGEQGLSVVGPQGLPGSVGPRGEKGDRGDQGIQGNQGMPGINGINGLNGSDGTDGRDGRDGRDGINGFGYVGDTGPAGQSFTGPKGDTGSQGSQGPRGDTGSQGSQGPQGDTGSQGVQGPRGDTGSQGSQGPRGDTGSLGSQGPRGDTGSQGIQGPRGDTGSQGSQGRDGMNGFGYTGPPGRSGQLTYALPRDGSFWVHLGTLSTTMYGNLSQFEICTQNEYATNDANFVLAKLLFSSTDGTSSQAAIDDNAGTSSPFFGVARVYTMGNYLDNSNFAIVQSAGQGSNVGTFQFYMIPSAMEPGNTWFVPTICPGDTFVYSGATLASEPPGARIMPQQGSLLGPPGPPGQSFTGPAGQSFTGPPGQSFTGPRGQSFTGPPGQSFTGPAGDAGEIRYRIPSPMGETMWCYLGTWSTNISDNRLCTLRITTQTTTFGFQRFRSAFLQLSSGDWNDTASYALDGSRFYAKAELQLTSNWPGAADDFFIQQVGQVTTTVDLDFKVYMRLYPTAGSGHYTATTSFDSMSYASDTWTHDGGMEVNPPTLQVITPRVVSGPTGPAGAASTIPGPKGDPGAASTIPGPKGDTGAASTVPGPKGDPGAASTVPGPKGDTGPQGKDLVMGPQYDIVWPIGITTPHWYRLGTFTTPFSPIPQGQTLNTGGGYRMLQIQATTQTFQGSVNNVTIDFVTNNGVVVQNTFDSPPVEFNAHARMQTTSPDWYLDTFATDVVVTQNSSSSYTFFLRLWPGLPGSGGVSGPGVGTGFFSVRHAKDDVFTFVQQGAIVGTGRPPNGIHPLAMPVTSVEQLDALPTTNPTATGTLTCQNLSVSGTVNVPDNSLSMADISGLSGALVGKATLGQPANFTSLSSTTTLGAQNATFLGTVALPRFQILQDATLNGTTNGNNIFGTLLMASLSLSSHYGTMMSMAANSSQTAYTLSANQRGLIFLETDAGNASSTVAYVSNMSGVNHLSILARNGNAFATQNMGTAFTGSYNMSVTLNSTGAIRVSVTNAGSVRWNLILLSGLV